MAPFGFFNKKKALEALELPLVEPGMNAGSESYFQEELKRLGEGVHLANLDRASGPFGEETSILVGGVKVGQLLRQYDEELGAELSLLKQRGVAVQAKIFVDENLEIRILIPFPQELLAWLKAPAEDRHKVSLKPPAAIRLKESQRFRVELMELLAGGSEWKGTLRLEAVAEESGKHAGSTKVLAYSGEELVGTVGARFRTQDLPIFELVEKASPVEVKGSVFLSKFNGEAYASVYL